MKHILKILILNTFFSVFYFTSFAQQVNFRIEQSGFTPTGVGVNDGKVTLYQDSKLLAIIHKKSRVNNNKFPGWRVQIFFGSGSNASDRANRIKTSFLMRYGRVYGTYIIYEAPYFKLRVGDFRSKAEAMQFKKKISRYYPNSWIIADIINYPEKM